MQHVTSADLDSDATAGGADHVALTDPLGAQDLAAHRYRLDPGDRLAGLHAHLDQEEVFYVLDGAVTFETLSGAVTVEADEVVRFEPGEFQSGTNAGERAATVLALGAPRDSAAIRIPLSCPECDHDAVRPTVVDGALTLECPECGHQVPGACPDCGSESVRAILGESGDPVAACRACGFRTETLSSL